MNQPAFILGFEKVVLYSKDKLGSFLHETKKKKNRENTPYSLSIQFAAKTVKY